MRPLAALGRRLIAVLEEGARLAGRGARARVEGASAGLACAARCSRPGARCSPAAGAARPIPISSTGSRSIGSRGANIDVGLHRHWLDPTRPLADDGAGAGAWRARHLGDACDGRRRGLGAAEARTGASHLAAPRRPSRRPGRSTMRDQRRSADRHRCQARRHAPLAGAYARADRGVAAAARWACSPRSAAQGGPCADRRPLARAGLPLYAQHVDPIDTGTLVDMFRDDPRASLLGTDALRDGVDVPGHSLRLVVHGGRALAAPDRAAHGARARRWRRHGAMTTASSARGCAQAFGRLIRRADDHGRFVLLSSAMPSRLLTPFRRGCEVRAVTLDEAVARSRAAFPAPSHRGHQARQPA